MAKHTDLSTIAYRQAEIMKDDVKLLVTELERTRSDILVRTNDGRVFWAKAEGWQVNYECDPVCNCGEPGCRGHQTSGNGSYYEDMTAEDLNCD